MSKTTIFDKHAFENNKKQYVVLGGFRPHTGPGRAHTGPYGPIWALMGPYAPEKSPKDT